MNATRDASMKSASHSTPIMVTPTANDERIEQRENNKRFFRAKYEAMLYVIEFIASFHLLVTKNPRQTKKMMEVKSLAAQKRNELGASTGKR